MTLHHRDSSSKYNQNNQCIVQCKWCSLISLEIQLSAEDQSEPCNREAERDQTFDTIDDSLGKIDECDMTVESVLFDRFKGSSCGDDTSLLEICSNFVGIQQPICKDCARDIQEDLSRGIEDWSKESLEYEKKIFDFTRGTEEHARDACRIDEFLNVNQEYKILQEELESLEQAKRAHERITEIENIYWTYYNVLNLHLHDAANLRDALQLQMDQSNHCLETLMPTTRHVLADMMDISKDNSSSVILSGCRLGGCEGVAPTWLEINTAWGQAVLLLSIVQELLAIQFNEGRIVLDPRGSYPRIFEQGKGYYELYGPVNKLLCMGFDKGQLLFLRCIQQVETELQERRVSQAKGEFVLHHPIKGDLVGGCSIRYSFSRDRVWTEAFGKMLINLEQCLCESLEFQGSKDITGSHALLPS